MLCTACTLCCNGVLFADVRLQRGDDARRLEEVGVTLSSAAYPRFRQPCSCLQAGTCRIYADRPKRCRTFECRLLQKTLAGEITAVIALRTIGAARKRVEAVRRILRELGDTDESLPLSRRYQRMMRQPIDLAADERLVQLRGQLMKEVAELASVLERHFVG
jgi:Fe-S-cluster containining protein